MLEKAKDCPCLEGNSPEKKTRFMNTCCYIFFVLNFCHMLHALPFLNFCLMLMEEGHEYTVKWFILLN